VLEHDISPTRMLTWYKLWTHGYTSLKTTFMAVCVHKFNEI